MPGPDQGERRARRVAPARGAAPPRRGMVARRPTARPLRERPSRRSGYHPLSLEGQGESAAGLRCGNAVTGGPSGSQGTRHHGRRRPPRRRLRERRPRATLRRRGDRARHGPGGRRVRAPLPAPAPAGRADGPHRRLAPGDGVDAARMADALRRRARRRGAPRPTARSWTIPPRGVVFRRVRLREFVDVARAARTRPATTSWRRPWNFPATLRRTTTASRPYCDGAPHLRAKVWLGKAGTVTPMHRDVPHNLHVHLTGRKRWLLFPPRHSAPRVPARPLLGHAELRRGRPGAARLRRAIRASAG